MVSEMFDKAIQFLKNHKEIALATSEGNLPKLRIFQIMKQEGHVLYFATSAQKAVYRELRQNPNVEILAYADNRPVSSDCSSSRYSSSSPFGQQVAGSIARNSVTAAGDMCRDADTLEGAELPIS